MDTITNTLSRTEKRRIDIINAPIASQLFKLTLPMVFAIFSIMSLGIVDSYFISHLGTKQLAAIGFITPIVFMTSGISLGMGMGISSLTARTIGTNKEKAASLITSGYYAISIIAIIVCLALFLFLEKIFSLIGADSSIFLFIEQYMNIWIFAGPLLMVSLVSSSMFRSIGDTNASAVVTLITTILNVLLDPLLIFGFGPIPAMGMHGAALATVIAIAVGLAVGLYKMAFKEKLIILSLQKLETVKQNWTQLSTIAIPAILSNMIVPITAATLTAIVATHGYEAVAVFGVGKRIEDISLLIMFALSSTVPMFIGQNLAAQKPHRIKQTLSIVFKFAVIWQLLIAIVLTQTAHHIAALFSDQQNIQQDITSYLCIIPISYGLFGIVILINVTMNMLGKPRTALYINTMRLTCLYFPLAYLGSSFAGLKGIFIAISVANCITFIIAYWMLDKVLTEKDIK